MPEKHANYNDDIRLGPFRPIRYTWAGGRRKAVTTHTADAASIDDHLRMAIREEFY